MENKSTAHLTGRVRGPVGRPVQWRVECHGLEVCLRIRGEAEGIGDPSCFARHLPPPAYGGHRLEEDSPSPGPSPGAQRHRLDVTLGSLPYRIHRDGRPVEEAHCQAALHEAVERQVDALLAEHSRRHLALHAGVVALGRGEEGGEEGGEEEGALLLAGTSGCGKSTLVEAFLGRGTPFLSDDLAMVGEDLRVHPYPRPLRRRTVSGEERIEIAALERTLPVRWIVLPTFEAGAPLESERLAGGSAVLALLAHTISARRDPGRALEVLGRLAQSVPVWRIRRGEADAAAREIERLVCGHGAGADG